ncbi:MAG: glycyl-radical enzyme activating protein [Clostridia bacterium]|nr:glycyl-radical enzyme activating protein [Clostridia bacterium]
MHTASILNIQHFSIHDGPGIRTTVFLKGCNLRCWWCHNPESQELGPQILFYPNKCIGCGACIPACPNASCVLTARFTSACIACGACAEVCVAEATVLEGKSLTEDELFDAIIRDASVYRRSGGGVTFSGGEPMLQHEMLASLLPRLREAGVHTAIETAANVPWERFETLLPHIDLFMCDIKHMDEDAHREHTGVGNRLILENLRRLASAGAEMILRTPVIPGVNDTPGDIRAIAGFVAELSAAACAAGFEKAYGLELLPYHNLGADKFAAMNREFRGAGIDSPSDEQMRVLAEAAREIGILCEAR